MKKLTLLLASVFAIAAQSMAHGNGTINSYSDAFVFDEMGVTFSVYPDGEFDFYLPNSNGVVVNTPNASVSFNSGYNYDAYVQYDDFGAIIQVENVPVWYDYYGRVNQIGEVTINYQNRRVVRVGGLQVYYSRHGGYAYHTGFINQWNPYFVHRPFYSSFRRPRPHLAFVQLHPYRQYYHPTRYTYYHPYVNNARPHYATIGNTYRPSGYGVTHQRYSQTAGRGERAVVRSQRTLTTANANARPSSTRNRTVDGYAARKPARNRSYTATKPSNVRATTSGSRTVTPRTSQSIQARSGNRSVTSKPSTVRQSSTNVARSSKPRTASSGRVSTRQTTTQSRSTARPTSTTRSQGTSRSTVSRNTSASRTSNRSAVKPRTTTRSTVAKPRSSSSSRSAAATSKGSSRPTKAASSSRGGSSSRPASKGISTKRR